MSFRDHLIHTCTIQSAATALSARGATVETWSDVAENVPCRKVEKGMRQAVPDAGQMQLYDTLFMFLPDASIASGYRIIDVALEDDSTDAGPYEVVEVLKRRSSVVRHISVRAKKVS